MHASMSITFRPRFSFRRLLCFSSPETSHQPGRHVVFFVAEKIGPLFSLNPDRVLLTGQASLSIVRCPFEMTRVRWGRPGEEGKGREGVAGGWGVEGGAGEVLTQSVLGMCHELSSWRACTCGTR